MGTLTVIKNFIINNRFLFYIVFFFILFLFIKIEKEDSFKRGYKKRDVELTLQYTKVLKQKNEEEIKRINELYSLIKQHNDQSVKEDQKLFSINKKTTEKILNNQQKFKIELSDEEIKKLNDMTKM